jgi:hypothetical protein
MFVCICFFVASAASPKNAEAEDALYNLIFNLQSQFGFRVLTDPELDILKTTQRLSTGKTQTIGGCYAIFMRLHTSFMNSAPLLMEFAKSAGVDAELISCLLNGMRCGRTMSGKEYVRIEFNSLGERGWENVSGSVYEDDSAFFYDLKS